ncbi:MAG: HAMP domain-containing sensor histidine kinase [Myxococcota bacterium]
MRRLYGLTAIALVCLPALVVLALGAAHGTVRQGLGARLLRIAQEVDVTRPETFGDRAREESIQLALYRLDGSPVVAAAEPAHQRNALGVASAGARRLAAAEPAPFLSDATLAQARDGEHLECVIREHADRCTATVRRGDSFVVAEARAARGLVRLLDSAGFLWARPLTVLALLGLVLGAGLVFLLTRRTVRPLLRLRAALAARTSEVIDTRPLHLEAPEEIGAVAGAFNRLLKALEEERQRADRLLQDLTHALKSPLAAIRTSLVVLEDGSSERALASAQAAIGRIDRTIARLLELSRAQAGVFMEDPRDFALDAMIAARVEAFRVEHAQLTVRLALVEAPVRALANACGRAMDCLLENAAHFAEHEILVRLERAEGGYLLSVLDDGPGIAAGDVERVFERFVGHRKGGTGIGLALVQAVAEAHGGKAWADAGPGGSFYVLLPFTSF